MYKIFSLVILVSMPVPVVSRQNTAALQQCVLVNSAKLTDTMYQLDKCLLLTELYQCYLDDGYPNTIPTDAEIQTLKAMSTGFPGSCDFHINNVIEEHKAKVSGVPRPIAVLQQCVADTTTKAKQLPIYQHDQCPLVKELYQCFLDHDFETLVSSDAQIQSLKALFAGYSVSCGGEINQIIEEHKAKMENSAPSTSAMTWFHSVVTAAFSLVMFWRFG